MRAGSQHVGDFYVRHEYVITLTQLVLAMFAMGARLHLDDFRSVFRFPASFLAGLGTQVVLVPLLAWAGLQALDLSPGVAIGLAIVACVPGGVTSNVFTWFSKGNVALSIAVTAVTTVATIVTVPIVLQALIGSHMPADFAMPTARIGLEIFGTLLVPLAVGMRLLQWRPEIAEPLAKWAMRLVLVVIVVIVLGAASADRLDWGAMDGTTRLAIVGLALGLFVLCGLVCLVTRRPFEDAVALLLEVTVRNTNLGLLVKASVFPAVVGVADPVADRVLTTLVAFTAVSGVFVLPVLVAGRLVARRREALHRGEDGADPDPVAVTA